MTCAGAVNLCDKLKEDKKGNIFSAEGSFAHSVRETCLEFGLDPYDLIGMTGREEGYDFECDQDMADHLQPGIDRIREFEGHMTVEYRVDLSRWMPGQFGTLDLGIAGPERNVISDLKYGMGVPVFAFQHWQQIIYALGFWDNIARHITDAKKFLIIIDQPRIATGGGEWETTLDELLELGEQVKVAAKRTQDPDAPRCASSKACMWCPASKIDGACPEYEAFVLSVVGTSFDDLDEMQQLGLPPQLPNPDALNPERRSFIVQNAHVFTKWLDRLHEQALEDAVAGRDVPGMKAVMGRSAPRKYTDAERAKKLVSEQIGSKGFKQVLLTPTQIEKQLGSDAYAKISDVVTRGDGKPCLVPLTDNRPALTPTVDKFDVLDNL